MGGEPREKGKIHPYRWSSATVNFAGLFPTLRTAIRMNDIFDKIRKDLGPIGRQAKDSHGYFSFPKLEGELGPHMTFRGKPVLAWSLNNYLGLANHPEVRKVDAEAAAEWGLAYPMGARMMSGQTKYHEELEDALSDFMQKEDTYLLNFGYQGCMSTIEALLSRHDVLVYDSECHACMVDGARLHAGRRFVYKHNDMESLEKMLEHARKVTERTGGGILVMTEGVFGMGGDQGKLKEIVALKPKYNFRLFVDDAHGFGMMGRDGRGTADAQGVQDEVDIYFGTFAKAMATIGAFISGPEDVMMYLRYNMRSQVFAKSLPMPIVIGAIKRLELMRTKRELSDKLWAVTHALQNGLREAGFDLGKTNSCVTPVYMHGGIPEATNAIVDLRENMGVFCSIVVYPVIPKGEILLRLIPTATHSLEDVKYTIECFKKVKEKMEAGVYKSDKVAAV